MLITPTLAVGSTLRIFRCTASRACNRCLAVSKMDFVAASLVLLPREERHMHEIGGFALSRISATVVASGRRHALVSYHLLDRRQVGASVEQLGDVGAAHVVWCE